eukprot:2832674-Amphidinium_carterae.1
MGLDSPNASAIKALFQSVSSLAQVEVALPGQGLGQGQGGDDVKPQKTGGNLDEGGDVTVKQ